MLVDDGPDDGDDVEIGLRRGGAEGVDGVGVGGGVRDDFEGDGGEVREGEEGEFGGRGEVPDEGG